VGALTELLTSKIPPHSLEAERTVLGAILLEPESLPKAVELLRPSDFYKEGHRQIFATMLALFERNDPVDLLTLSEELRRRGGLDEVGGPAALAALVEEAATAAHLTAYAGIVREKALLRELIRISTEIIGQSYEAKEDVDSLLDQAEQLIFRVSERRMEGTAIPVSSILKETFEYIERLYEKKEHVTGLPTGFPDLDRLTSGLQPSDFILIAGRPSMGKTALALNIAKYAGIEFKKKVLLLSLEMSKEQLVQRLLCAEARVDSSRVRNGYLESKDWARLTNAAGRLHEAPIFIDDTAALTVLDARAKARRMKAEHGLDLIVIDYLQLMRGRNPDNRQQEISEISRSLKAMAKELRVPVVGLSQLSRAVETRPTREHRPQLSDLRECVTGETLVVLADGRRVPIRDLVGTAPEVLAISPEGKIVEAKSEKVWRVGTKPVFSIRLASGRVIRTTERHRLFAARGWNRVGELAPGDRLAIARRLPEPTFPDCWPDPRVALLGQLIGDGSYLNHQPLRYTTSSEENSQVVSDAAREEFGCEVKRYEGRGTWHQLLISGNGNRWRPDGVNRWLRELGIFGQRSYEKRVPESVFRLSNSHITLLLRHLWATDGTIAPRTNSRGSHSVSYSTNSPGLAGDVAALLLRLGIVARISTAQKGSYRPTFFVAVSGVTDQRRFLEAVGAFGPRKPQARHLESLLAASRANTNVDTLPVGDFERVKGLMRTQGISQRRMAALRGTAYGGSSHFRFAPSRAVLAEYAEILEDTELHARATSDLFWDRIVTIEAGGEEEVFDLTVPGPASWLADGIVSHNSGALEQDADLILFLYRPDRYKEKSEIPPERQNLAEVIIGKQRNGPVETVELTFLPEYASFENRAAPRRQPF
jgi:replicative DNA helicase